MDKPRIALTIGDPAGIGPEIARQAACSSRVTDVCEPVIYAPPTEQRFAPGVLSAEAGRAAYDIIVAAVRDAQAGIVDGIATAPVNKLAFAQAGLPWKGHTDLLGHLTGAKQVAMPEVMPLPTLRAPRFVTFIAQLLEVARPAQFSSWRLVGQPSADPSSPIAGLPYGISIACADGTTMLLMCQATGAMVGAEPTEEPFPEYVIPESVTAALDA